jgi:hypothetical protein
LPTHSAGVPGDAAAVRRANEHGLAQHVDRDFAAWLAEIDGRLCRRIRAELRGAVQVADLGVVHRGASGLRAGATAPRGGAPRRRDGVALRTALHVMSPEAAFCDATLLARRHVAWNRSERSIALAASS